jgi:hypothetical protein
MTNYLMLSAFEICALQDEKVRLEIENAELRKEMEIKIAELESRLQSIATD